MAEKGLSGDVVTVLKKEAKIPVAPKQPAIHEHTGNLGDCLGVIVTSKDPCEPSADAASSCTVEVEAPTEAMAVSIDATVLSTATVWYVDHNATEPEVSNTLALEDKPEKSPTGSGNSVELPLPCPGAGYGMSQNEYLTPTYVEPGIKSRLKVQRKTGTPEGEDSDDDLDDVFEDLQLSSSLESSSCSDSSGSFEISPGGGV
ncbi:uncharacterized protein LOC135479546 [Liolophura sinensis]|uniref:uncharacterized protein LOC135479546 n=1 Tax=Liolophura sinensis TaxID=3198878 RepID=UPI0031591F5F